MNQLEILLNRGPFRCGISVAMKVSGGRNQFVKAVCVAPVEDGDLIPVAGHMTDLQAQSLLNQLWELGFRPADGTGNAGHVGALQDHIKDLRWMAEQSVGLLKNTVGG